MFVAHLWLVTQRTLAPSRRWSCSPRQVHSWQTRELVNKTCRRVICENGQVVRSVESFSISCANTDTAVRSRHRAVRLLVLLTTSVLKENNPQSAPRTYKIIKTLGHERRPNQRLFKCSRFDQTLESLFDTRWCHRASFVMEKSDPNRFIKCV